MKALDFLNAPVSETATVFVISGADSFLRAQAVEKILGSLEEDVEVRVDAMGLPRGTHDLVPEVSVPDGMEVRGVIPERVTVTLR